MHELSIAYDLIKIANQTARQAGATRVKKVYLRLGRLSGVAREALQFSYDIAAQGTMFEGSHLIIEDVPVVIYCEQCNRERELRNIQDFRCPHCGAPARQIRQGKELELSRIEIETAD